MAEDAKISIVVPVYNAAEYIGETINSVLAQSYTNWELILVNDQSKDNSVEVIKKYLSDERIKLFFMNQNGGAAKARNKGIEEATGRYLAFIDSDDLWLPEKLSKQLEYMKKEDCSFSFTAYEFGDENAVGTGKIVSVPRELSYKRALSRTIIFTSTVMFDLKKISKEMVAMPIIPSEDTATWWKVLRNGTLAHGINEVLTIYRRPKASLSSNKLVAIKRIWNLYRRSEGLGIVKSIYYLFFWALRATLRRI